MADPNYFVKQRQFTKTTYRDAYPAIDPAAVSNSQAGKVIVITGASQGLGRNGFAKSFAKAGPKGIVIVARSAEKLEATRQDILAINKDVKVLAVPTDLTSAESVASLWKSVKETFGKADVLVNNAGSLTPGTIADTPVDTWWGDFETNVRGTFLLTQGFLALLGKESHGTIINVISAVATFVVPGMSGYSLSKLIAIQIQGYIAAEHPNVTAVALHPGIILSEMTQEMFRPFAKDTPELVGNVGVWLATEKAVFLNGKYVESNWSVDELMGKKGEIVEGGKLSLVLKGEFGEKQFL